MATPERRTRKGPATVDPATNAAADATIATIRKYYAYGQRALAASPKGVEAGIQQLAAEAGVSLDLIRKARAFAKLYDERALEELLRLRTPRGLPLSWPHVRHLVTVEDADRRAALARQAAAGGWTIRELKDAAEALRGGPARGAGGAGDAPDAGGVPAAAGRAGRGAAAVPGRRRGPGVSTWVRGRPPSRRARRCGSWRGARRTSSMRWRLWGAGRRSGSARRPEPGADEMTSPGRRGPIRDRAGPRSGGGDALRRDDRRARPSASGRSGRYAAYRS